MKNLIKMDLLKEVKKKSFVVSILLIIITSFFVTYFINKKEFKNETNITFQEKISEKDFLTTYSLSSYDNYLFQYEKYSSLMKENIKLSEYNDNNRVKEVFNQVLNIQVFLSILVAFIGGNIMNAEFNSGTIKTICSSSYKRTQIVLSKLISLLIVTLVLNAVLLISMMLFTCIFTGNVFALKEYIVNGNSVTEINYFLFVVVKYLVNSVPLLFVCFLSLFLSTLFTNNSISTSIGMVICITGNIISQVLIGLNFKIIQYTFLPYVDFSVFNNKISLLLANMELGVNINIKSATIILIVNALIMYFLSNIIFVKKDIKC